MRPLLRICLGCIIAIGLFTACSGKKEEGTHEHHDVAKEEWEEMDNFHTVMADAFHPYMESSNLEPAKTNAPALAASAAKWSESTLPEKMNNDQAKAKLQQLKADAATFAETVKAGDDKAIAESLTKLHDLFHEIQELWYGASADHHHQH